jgi:hypothetical protein
MRLCCRYAHTYKEARAWLAELLQLADCCSPSRPLVVGVDTETAVKWGQQQANTPMSLLQLCYHAGGSSKVCGAVWTIAIASVTHVC